MYFIIIFLIALYLSFYLIRIIELVWKILCLVYLFHVFIIFLRSGYYTLLNSFNRIVGRFIYVRVESHVRTCTWKEAWLVRHTQ